ncbi:hypothetical protein [Nocardia rhizosphaerihabitans]|uniref:Tetratricopeptide repeat protein n=1 Tax=Nocardia rhizosphaerihabitans TaxID=1691570 RepID=A0ABQ2L2G4_9NOCA|nr:hypothetical protein [Nocardia rhizosphaerihabitans]GGN97871.1 hypothetical protein GCM10011610_64310 [Nocardia rhizosphaerihabitans]
MSAVKQKPDGAKRSLSAEPRLAQGCAAGRLWSRHWHNDLLGWLHLQRGELTDYETWWCKAADTNDPNAMINFGYLLELRGALFEAETWYRRVADADTRAIAEEKRCSVFDSGTPGACCPDRPVCVKKHGFSQWLGRLLRGLSLYTEYAAMRKATAASVETAVA